MRAVPVVGIYQNRILPYIVHVAMRQSTFAVYRRRVVPAAGGCVLEIGVGSGLNAAFYSDQARHVIGLEPSTRLLAMARGAGGAGSQPIELVQASAEAIPLGDNSVDSVVSTWTLCSIPDVTLALGEVRRVLKPSGRLLFVEHGLSPDRRVSRWQHRLTPLWKRIGGGCHLNRPIALLIEAAGFRIENVTTGYMEGPKPVTFMYEGSARVI
jgi:ubiquinone/menaquinone biosynthesis C-methylase UbiE